MNYLLWNHIYLQHSHIDAFFGVVSSEPVEDGTKGKCLQSPVFNNSKMRGSNFVNATMFSRIAFTLPGKVTIKVLCLVPTTGRDNTASGVCFNPSFNKTCAMPGAWRWSNGNNTSGVISLGPNPVPPVVKSMSTLS